MAELYCLNILFNLLLKLVLWAKKMPKGAYLFMAIFPLLSLFYIPPPVFENVAKAKHEQRKKQKRYDKPTS
ncbi:hypothetical protein ACN9JF_07820 [Pseudoalteromonas lipolytica]|uniref:hypothetical protein n=1 Tax=Pseudoalteromonas lipolytica TaxID=570156 RepID=UPI003BA19DD7